MEKPGEKIDPHQEIVIKQKMPYKSRGGIKLAKALDEFTISPEGKVAADLGASTGGFTDCLLQKGAKKVYAVDVDTRQIDWSLRNDTRVILIEKNARFLDRCDFNDELDLVTTDLSFISILKVLPAIKKLLNQGELVSLIKPQFEAGKDKVGKGGVIKDIIIHQQILKKIIEQANLLGFSFQGLIKSPLLGQKGNVEFFIHWNFKPSFYNRERIETIIREVVRDD